MTAVANKGEALRFAAEELKGDREVVMAAAANNGAAFRFAAEGLRGDRDVVMQAVSQDSSAVIFVAKEVWGDDEVMQAALEASPDELVGLKVLLLSGRSCNMVFHRFVPMGLVKRRCAMSLDLDPNIVARRGSFILGEVKITSITQLPPGKAHELTLVLS